MNRQHNKKSSCYRSNTSGAAMVLVLCLMAVFMALALTVLFSASSIMRNVTSGAVNKRCQILAESLSEVLDEEMLEKQDTNNQSGPVTIQDYIRYHLDLNYSNTTSPLWNYYREDGGVGTITSRTYKVSMAANNLPAEFEKFVTEEGYEITVEFCWILNSDSTYFEYPRDDVRWQKIGCDTSKMRVSAVCSHGDQTYKVNRTYQLDCTNCNEEIKVPGSTEENPDRFLIDVLEKMNWYELKWEWHSVEK